MQRILLIQSLNAINDPPVFPLGLSYLATFLRDYELDALDLNLSEDPYGDLVKRLKDFAPDIVGLSIRNIKIAAPGLHVSCLEDHKKTVRVIKEICPHVCLVAGGSAFSMYGQAMMEKLPGLDLGIFGEGEKVFPLLLQNMHDPPGMKGVYWREDGVVQFTGMPERLDFSKIPAPDRERFFPGRYTGNPAAIGVQTKRGCQLRCLYCSDLYLLGHTVSIREPEAVVAELEELKERWGIGAFFFADQLFNLPQKYAEEIVVRMHEKKLGMKWLAWFNEKGVSDRFVRLCRETGLLMLNFSPDAAMDSRLAYLGKNTRVADMQRTVRISKQEKMPLTYNFLINGPGETPWTLFRTLWWVFLTRLRLGRLFQLHGSMFHLMRIYPETPLYAIAREKNIISSKTDLMEPVFYNPHPLRYPVLFFLKLLGLVSKVRHALGGSRGDAKASGMEGAAH